MSELTPLSDAQWNRLERTVLHNPSASARKEALLEIRKLDHPRLTDLLRQVSAEDKDAEVRDLAHNLLRKREIERALQRGSFEDLPATAPFDLPPAADAVQETEAAVDQWEYQQEAAPDTPPTLGSLLATAWTCRFCGTENSGGNDCISCGAARSVEETEDEAPRKRKPETVNDFSDAFLLQPANMAFLLGQRTIASTFSSLGTGCGILFMLPFLLVGIFVIMMAIGEWRTYTLLNTSGMVVRGEYTGRYYDEDDDDGGVTYYANYQYEVDGQFYNGSHSVGQDVYNRVEEGAGVNIIYAPSDPGVSRIEGTNDLSTPAFLTIFSVCWNAISWGMFLVMVIGRRRDRELARSGQVVRGELLNITGRRDSDGDYQVTAEYRFIPPDGGDALVRKQSAQRNDLKNAVLPDTGTPVMVLYKDRKRFKML